MEGQKQDVKVYYQEGEKFNNFGKTEHEMFLWNQLQNDTYTHTTYMHTHNANMTRAYAMQKCLGFYKIPFKLKVDSPFVRCDFKKLSFEEKRTS